jgi:hypothetical protein
MIRNAGRQNIKVEGYIVYDPRRHDPASVPAFEVNDNLKDLPSDLVNFIRKVGAVGWPKLNPLQIKMVVSELSRLINDGETERNPLSCAVRDEIAKKAKEGSLDPDLVVSRTSINFLLTGMLYENAQLGENCSTEEDVRSFLYRSLKNLVRNRIGDVQDSDEVLIRNLLSLS